MKRHRSLLVHTLCYTIGAVLYLCGAAFANEHMHASGGMMGEYNEQLQVGVLADGSLAFEATYTITQRVEHACITVPGGYPLCTTNTGRLPASHLNMFLHDKVRRRCNKLEIVLEC